VSCSSSRRSWVCGRRTGSRGLAAAVAAVLMVGTFGVAITAGVAAAGPITGVIDVGEFPSGVAVNPAGTVAYVTEGDDGRVTVIDLSSNAVIATIDVGDNPDAVAINPAGTDAYVTNAFDATVSVIDLSTKTLKASINVGTFPRAVAVNPAGTDAYVTNSGDATVSVINLSTNAVIATIPVGTRPTGVAVNPAGTDAYVTDQAADTVSVINLSTLKVTATIPVGDLPLAIAVNPTGTDAYVTNEDTNTVSVINLSTLTVTATILVGEGPFGVAVNSAGTAAYVTNSDDGTVSYIDLSTDSVTATVQVISSPQVIPSPLGIAVNPNGTDAYVADYSHYTVTVLDVKDPVAPGAPGRPSIVDGDHQATVSVTPPTLGGIPTSYTITAADSTSPNHGRQKCTVHGATGACTLGELTNGDAYNFTATATNSAGTSTASPASNHVVPAPPADLAVTLNGPNRATDGTTFTQRVTVTDHGPSDTTAIETTLLVAGLTVTSAPGATIHSGTPVWTIPALASGQSVVYPVTLEVDADTNTVATIGAVTEDDGYDPNPANNADMSTIRLLPRWRRCRRSTGCASAKPSTPISRTWTTSEDTAP
jgi:YVTN family beta-propeller protein